MSSLGGSRFTAKPGTKEMAWQKLYSASCVQTCAPDDYWTGILLQPFATFLICVAHKLLYNFTE